MSKQTDLLKLLMPIILKYDYPTVKKTLQYILDNEEKFKICKKMNDEFIKGLDITGNKTKNKESSEINSIINGNERNKKVILKNIYNIIIKRKLKIEQICKSIMSQSDCYSNIDINSLEELFEILSKEDIDKLKRLENIIVANLRSKNSENSLENWSNLIIKE